MELRNAGVEVMEVSANGNRFISRRQAILQEDRIFNPHIIVSFDISATLHTVLAVYKRKGPLLITIFSGNYIPTVKIRLAFRCLCHFLHRIICNSHDGARYLRRRFHIGEERLRVISNGLDFKAMARPMVPVGSLRREIPLPEKSPLVGVIGKLTVDKDPLNLVAAASIVARKFPDAVFCYIGSGPLHEATSSALRAQNLASRFFLIPRRPDAPWLAKEFDIAVLCSRSEGLPNAILEYMYWGKPCVVTAAGDSGRVVVDGETGFVVPIERPEALAQAILRLLADPELARSMGQQGRRRLEDHYPIQQYVQEFQDFFDSLTPSLRRQD